MQKSAKYWFVPIGIILILLVLTINCKKEELSNLLINSAVVKASDYNDYSYITIDTIRNITNTSAICDIIISEEEINSIIGVYWGTESNPAISDNKTIGTITKQNNKIICTCVMSNLTPNTKYYVMAYIINIYGTTNYSEIISFTTLL